MAIQIEIYYSFVFMVMESCFFFSILISFSNMNKSCVVKKVSLLVNSLVISESLLFRWKLFSRRDHLNTLVKLAAPR